jgi:predicted transposase YdaD
MLLGEWNFEDMVRVREREAREDGLEQGLGKAAKNLFEYGMTPEQVAQALKMPMDTVLQYRGRQ